MRQAISQTNRVSNELRLGYVPLLDSAPMIVAHELGFLENEGLATRLCRQPGWACIRDKMLFGDLDAAHAPGGFLFAINAGATSNVGRCLTAFVMSAQGNAITVSRKLYDQGVRDASDFASLAHSRPADPLSFGVVSRHSSHAHLLNAWLRSGGVDVEQEMRLVVLPPQQMVASLAAGHIDGFCAGEPWNTFAESEGAGQVLADSATLAPMHPEKVLLVHEDFANLRHDDHMAILRAHADACDWCADPAHRGELASLLVRVAFPNLQPELIMRCLESSLAPVFSGPGLHIPDKAKATWLLKEMRREAMLPDQVRDEELLSSFRVDYFESMNESWKQFDYDD